ncbi:GNAT family N-acetyltransferase [Saccharomonospora xinjiangensis]|uniref:GNAT family N-acetyltransferase n=1 Tax=Saccharomonospora xinjiangensis TaxID=75294 RepID=UPI0002E70AC9|nr:GNAT family N-acetyltransferase [Saccharomonospora xinjiangensis]
MSWRAAYVNVLPGDYLAGLSITDRQRAWRRWFIASHRSARVLVVADGETVVGFACVGASRDDDAAAATGELQSIYLDPAKWGLGLGRLLHAEALATLRRDGYRRATLWVLDGNAVARRFYERAGWTEDGATKVDTIGSSPPLKEVRYLRAL